MEKEKILLVPLGNFTKSILNMKNEDKRGKKVFIVGQWKESLRNAVEVH